MKENSNPKSRNAEGPTLEENQAIVAAWLAGKKLTAKMVANAVRLKREYANTSPGNCIKFATRVETMLGPNKLFTGQETVVKDINSANVIATAAYNVSRVTKRKEDGTITEMAIKELVEKLDAGAEFVINNCNNDPKIADSSGYYTYEVRRDTVPAPGTCTGAGFNLSKRPGQVFFFCDALGDGVKYIVERKDSKTGIWVEVGSGTNSRKIVVNNIPRGDISEYRIFGRTSGGDGEPCPPFIYVGQS